MVICVCCGEARGDREAAVGDVVAHRALDARDAEAEVPVCLAKHTKSKVLPRQQQDELAPESVAVVLVQEEAAQESNAQQQPSASTQQHPPASIEKPVCNKEVEHPVLFNDIDKPIHTQGVESPVQDAPNMHVTVSRISEAPAPTTEDKVDTNGDPVDDRGGHEGRRSADVHCYLLAILFRSTEPDEEALVGFKLATMSDEQPQGYPEQTVHGFRAAFVRVVQRLPMHFVRETGHSLLPIAMGVLPMLICGVASQAFRQQIPDHTLTIKELEFRAPEMDTGGKLLTVVPAQMCISVIGLAFFFTCRGVWKKDVFSWWLRTFMPFMLSQYIYYFARPFLAAKMGGSSIDRIGFMLAVLTQSLAVLVFFKFVGRANKNPWFMQYGLCIAVSINGVYYIYRTRMVMIVAMSDVAKIVVVGLANPLLLQMIVVLNVRLCGRALHFNDPSTSWILMGVGLVWEKAYARIIIATMDSIIMVGAASAASAAGSGLVLAILGIEDRNVYLLIGKCLGVQEPQLNATHPRNTAYRTSVYVFDFVVELVMIVCFAAWPHAYNMSIDGQVPDVGLTISKLTMQIVMQYTTSSVQITYVTLFRGVDYIIFARNRCQYWGIMAGVFCAFATSMMCTSMIVSVLCGAPLESGASYETCRSE